MPKTIKRKAITISNGRIKLKRKSLTLTKKVKKKIKLKRKKLDTRKLKNNRRRTGIYA